MEKLKNRSVSNSSLRTIDKIIPFSLSDEQMLYLEQAGFCNGCGGEGKNLDKQLRAMIEIIPGFNEEKSTALFLDFRKICFAHDLDFYTKQGFIRSNYRMGVRVSQLIHWAGYRRFIVGFTLFYILMRYGMDFYNGLESEDL